MQFRTLTALAASTLFASAGAAQCGGSSACSSHRDGDMMTANTSSTILASLQHSEKNIVETAVAAGSFNTLAAALKAAGLVDVLSGEGPFTVFAPTDEAFSKLPAGTVESLLKPENKDKLISVLTYHVVAGEVPASKVVNLKGATTVNGQRADIKVKDGTVMVDGAKVVTTDIEASNGVIHVIDSVILPESKNILEVAGAAGSFNTLAAALKATGLDAAVTSDGPLTVFAPTDEAFSKLPAGTVEKLLRPENLETLKSILLYHVVDGRVYSEQALKLHTAPTLNGQTVHIHKSPTGATVGNANLVKTDIDASNGVIHVIDTVLLPR